MTALCPSCGGKTKVREVFSENHLRTPGWRRGMIEAGRTLRLKRCAQGHRFHTVELTEVDLDAITVRLAELEKLHGST